MPRRFLICLLLAFIPPLAQAVDTPAALPRTVAPAGATVYFISPTDGARVKSPFVVRFGLSGMGVAPAGIQAEHTGHHHLLVDVGRLPPEGQPLPNDAQHLHFGKGQTETTLTLPPGSHTLQLIVGDHLHVPHLPPVVSAPIRVVVE